MAIYLRPLEEVVAELRTSMADRIVNQIKYVTRDHEQRIERVTKNRDALVRLDEAGFEIRLGSWQDGSSYALELGFFPNTKAGNKALSEQLRKARMALGCRLEGLSKSVANEKKRTVLMALSARDYPGISVTFERKLPTSAKCRLVKEHSTYYSLVCDA